MSTLRKSTRAPWAERLDKILAREGNDKCGDCDTPNPRWVSSNVGSIVCIRCSGIHRSLGTHISRIRSVELDDWSDEQIQFLDRKGNKRVNLIYEANIPSATKKITAQSPFEEATSFIKAKYNGEFKSAATNGWKGATVAQDTFDDDKKPVSSPARSPIDPSPDSDPRRRTLFLKNALSARNQALDLKAGADSTDSEDDSEGAAGDSRRIDDQARSRSSLKTALNSSGEVTTDAATEVWNTLEQTGVGSDLKRMQMEERKRMMNEAKQKKEAKKKEEKERKKKEDEQMKRKKKDDKKQKRKSWWRGRAMDGEAIALKHELEQMMGQSDDTFSAVGSEDDLKNKRENDHRRVKERMRLYEEVKRQKRGQTVETTCPHCHSHIPLLSQLQQHSHQEQTRAELDVSAE